MRLIKPCLLSTICGVASFSAFADEAITYYHSDVLGSPVAATDHAGYVRWRAAYRPYGDRDQTPTEQLASADNKKWFTGHVHDEETGLTYAGARYYDPTLGRFLSIDPLSFSDKNEQTFGRYTYVNNNPYKFVDPSGEKLEFAAGSSEAFKAAVAEAIAYHNEHGTSGVFARLQEAQEVVYIQEATTRYDDRYSPSTRTIFWDPHSGAEVARYNFATGQYDKMTGNVQTPALGLLHEAAHARYHLRNPSAFARDANAKDPRWGVLAERDAIQKYEDPAAMKIGEPVRTNAFGKAVTVACPTCTK